MMSFHDPAFKTIKMSRTKLIDILKTNKSKHADEFEKALRGYQKKFLKRAEALLKVVKKAVDEELRVAFTEQFGLQAPQNYIHDYEAAISMLEHHEAEQVELNHQEFNAFVRDEWQWKNLHTLNFANYSGPAGPTGSAGPQGIQGPTGGRGGDDFEQYFNNHAHNV